MFGNVVVLFCDLLFTTNSLVQLQSNLTDSFHTNLTTFMKKMVMFLLSLHNNSSPRRLAGFHTSLFVFPQLFSRVEENTGSYSSVFHMV